VDIKATKRLPVIIKDIENLILRGLYIINIEKLQMMLEQLPKNQRTSIEAYRQFYKIRKYLKKPLYYIFILHNSKGFYFKALYSFKLRRLRDNI
jgi:hypothetical protein